MQMRHRSSWIRMPTSNIYGGSSREGTLPPGDPAPTGMVFSGELGGEAIGAGTSIRVLTASMEGGSLEPIVLLLVGTASVTSSKYAGSAMPSWLEMLDRDCARGAKLNSMRKLSRECTALGLERCKTLR